MNTDDLLTITDAAKELGVSVGAVRIAIREDRLPHVFVLRKKHITKAALAEYKNRTQPEGVPVTGRPKRKTAQ